MIAGIEEIGAAQMIVPFLLAGVDGCGAYGSLGGLQSLRRRVGFNLAGIVVESPADLEDHQVIDAEPDL